MSQLYRSIVKSLSMTSRKAFASSVFSNGFSKSSKNARKIALSYARSENFFGFSSSKKPEAETPKEEEKKQEKQEQKKAEEPQKPKTEEKKPNEQQKANTETKESPKNMLEKLLEMEKSKETEVKIKTLFQQKENEIKEKETKIADLEKKLKRADEAIEDNKKKIIDLRDNLMHQIEEVNLTRKRVEKEKKDLKDFAVSKFAKDLLDVIDNLERAVQNSTKEYEGKNNDLFEGVNMTYQLFGKILENNQMKKINPLKEKFNPNYHEALFEIADEQLEPGTVGYVAQFGYSINDRVLRAARVGVVKGTPKANNQNAEKKEEKKEEAKK